MDAPIIVGIDVGTTKVCTLVARLEENERIHILGVGIEPSQGIRKGTVVDLNAASKAIAHSVEKAERTSGLEIDSALVSLAGSHVTSINSKGVVGVSGRTIDYDDILRAVDAARAVSIPHNREVIHVIQRGFTVDNAQKLVGQFVRWRPPRWASFGGQGIPLVEEDHRGGDHFGDVVDLAQIVHRTLDRVDRVLQAARTGGYIVHVLVFA